MYECVCVDPLLAAQYPATRVCFLARSELHLQEVLSKLASLDADLNEKRAKKAQLEADVHMCTVKLDRAQKLIAGLGGEKSRWTAVAARLGQQFVALTGDIVLSAAQIAYLGRLCCSRISSVEVMLEFTLHTNFT